MDPYQLYNEASCRREGATYSRKTYSRNGTTYSRKSPESRAETTSLTESEKNGIESAEDSAEAVENCTETTNITESEENGAESEEDSAEAEEDSAEAEENSTELEEYSAEAVESAVPLLCSCTEDATWTVECNHEMRMALLADLEIGEYTDVSFVVGPETNLDIVSAHRLPLACVNAEFRNLFEKNYGDAIRINPKIHVQGFTVLIRYLYGDVDYLPSDAIGLFRTHAAAKEFKEQELLRKTKLKMNAVVKYAGVLKSLEIAIENNFKGSKEYAFQKISYNFRNVLLTEELFQTPIHIVEEITKIAKYDKDFKLWALISALEYARINYCSEAEIRRLLQPLEPEKIVPSEEDIRFRKTMADFSEYQHNIVARWLNSVEFQNLKIYASQENTQEPEQKKPRLL
ncbi:uncharacterized protein LOC129958397 [Argiope bruennichi]|uniref:BTB domain-containing protein n=1 Tax=Argiope bruennichi TaxID=94029 RepID=A0A8T0F506_ARGBR|nr:uncharacterized protein LOC129958397 [Argiope bruennichi]KAF8785388.1 hypothetical protein HNY73_010933 [Argiope bruennichi]